MENFEITLFRCFEILDFSFNEFLTNKSQRLIFQKYGLFIDEIFGVGVGRYGLYIHGPYNSQLASVGYIIARNLEFFRNSKRVSITDRAEKILNILREVFQPTLSDTRTIETYSTYFYLLNKESIEPSNALDKTIKIKRHILPTDEIKNIIDRISSDLNNNFVQSQIENIRFKF
jgi:hypothetical protein